MTVNKGKGQKLTGLKPRRVRKIKTHSKEKKRKEEKGSNRLKYNYAGTVTRAQETRVCRILKLERSSS